jgi:hypothetical protein
MSGPAPRLWHRVLDMLSSLGDSGVLDTVDFNGLLLQLTTQPQLPATWVDLVQDLQVSSRAAT